jgi:nucleoside-diphosphate-sugar epimerase
MINSGNVLVTGASGFVGGHLLKRLAYRKEGEATGTVRMAGSVIAKGSVAVGNIDHHTDWSAALKNQQVVIHTAARAHIMNDQAAEPLTAFREVNVAGTLNLARQAAAAGVRRFVFISSIKVNGEQTAPGRCFTADDTTAPQDPYGISKLEAEQGLQQIALETGMEVVIIRPPLVYGPGVKGNFASMIKLVEKGLPLPFGAIDNRRSLVGLDNLVDLIITCIDHPSAANQVFLVSDGEDLSTSGLLRRVAKAMGKPSRLIPVPAGLLQLGATVLGKKAVSQRLLGSLQVDIDSTRERLDWTPPVSVDEGLRRCFETHGY